MEFSIGFVLGGVSTGVAVANWNGILKAFHASLAKLQATLQGKAEAASAALKAKI